MSYAEELNPTESVLAFYATELRRRREAAGMSQRALAKEALMAPSLLNKVEAARRLPTKPLSEVADRLLAADEFFTRLWPVVIKHAYPAWFRPFVELEEAATEIRSFQAQLVPGLLQTSGYARAVLAGGRPNRERVDELVTARLARQHVLERPEPPELWLVLDQNVLCRRMGGVDTMRGQLERLLEAAETPHIVLQIVPFDAGGPCGDGRFILRPDAGRRSGCRLCRRLSTGADLRRA
ncbi:helix-turn-helix domain-containing protein [Streptomyces liangshanensis]|uniref:helix-turn-helix domain-containing protein n=1 Tax=Streptomyces liangshanensis TaxID=2717324 RepID=UPI002444C5FC|nr:Scr1 family TA system antitoxin-like transcriptional regulator [Streptomyces liangshanensis]